MKCYHPIDAYKLASGGITFNHHERDTTHIHIPCGQCIGCRERRASQWALRITHESQLYYDNCFITLTYERDKLPPKGSLQHKDFADFMKRLRYHNGPGVRFFMCGEYGPKTQRPHYHACIFGKDFQDRKPKGKSKSGFLYYESEELTRTWGMGIATVQDLTPETAGYCAGYVMQLATGDLAKQKYARTINGQTHQVEPEYCQMSRDPGIGALWFELNHRDLYPHDHAVTSSGRELPVPRYYHIKAEGKQYDLDEIEYARLVKAAQHAKDQTPERLAVQETVHQARNRNKLRNFDHDEL